jgi:two-component system response regulator RegX3
VCSSIEPWLHYVISCSEKETPLPLILIIGDESYGSQSLSTCLELHGFEVEVIESGSRIIEAVEALTPDLVLLDNLPPGKNALEACRRLRTRSTVPVIILTTRDEEMDHVQGLETGADDYVVKPYSFRELLARIRALLRRVALDHQSLQKHALTIGQIRLVPDSRKVYKDEIEIDLSAREFDLLEMLMKRTGQAIDRDELLETVWGRESIEDYRTLFVHIHWLRTKIEDDPAEPVYIQNVRGFGYRFISPEEL